MIYSHRHTIDNANVIVNINNSVTFEQLLFNPYPTGTQNWYLSGFEYSNGAFSSDNQRSPIYLTQEIAPKLYNSTDKYYFSYYSTSNYYEPVSTVSISIGDINVIDESFLFYTGDNSLLSNGAHYGFFEFNEDFIDDIGDIHTEYFRFNIYKDLTRSSRIAINNFQLINVGGVEGLKDLSAEEIYNVLNDTYDYGTFTIDLSYDIYFNDTDIMSQFTYSLYNAVTKYFNMDEVINLGAVHTWITDNVFNGNMPMGVTIVWHLICYQFVVDLIFLIYGLFMFIIDFADKCMTSFYDKSFGGGR